MIRCIVCKIESIVKRVSVFVPVRQRIQIPSLFDKRQNADCFILCMIDKSFFCKWGYDDSGNTGTRSPFLVNYRRGNMIPETTVFIVGNDDHSIVAIWTVQDVIDQFQSMIFSPFYVRITRMLIIYSQWFYK